MGARQINEMMPAMGRVYEGVKGPDDPPTACCTLEATTPSGEAVWIQAMAGTVNMGYPFAEEPLAMLRSRGVRVPADTYLVEWAAGQYATFGFGNLTPSDHASLVDRLFVKVFGCDDEGYELTTLIEPLET